jgi:hypothetical protein
MQAADARIRQKYATFWLRNKNGAIGLHRQRRKLIKAGAAIYV